MTLPNNFFARLQQAIPNSLFRKKHHRIYFSDALNGLFLRLTDSPLRLPTRAQVRQRVLHSHNYSKTFDPAPIFRHRGLLNICEVFARHLVQPSNNIIQRRPVKPDGARFHLCRYPLSLSSLKPPMRERKICYAERISNTW